MKVNYYLLLLFLSSTAFSQENSYVDSLDVSIKKLSKEKQLEEILKIPYDKFIGNISKSEILTNKAVEIAVELNDSLSLAQAYSKLSLIYTYKDKREKKILYSLKAITVFEKLEEFDMAGNSYGELGFMLKHENIDDALLYMRKGIRLIKNSKSSKIDALYDNYGILQAILENFDSAIYYHNKSLMLKKANNDSIGIPYGYAHIATVNIIQKNFDIAKKYIDSSYVIRKKRNDIYGIADVYAYYGDLYFEQEDHLKSIDYFIKGFDLSKENKFYNLQKYCAEKITSSYRKLNNYKKAFQYNTIYQSLKDSTLNAQTNSRVAELQIEFETEKKEKEIAVQKEEILEQELQIKNKNLFNTALGSGLLLVCLLSFGVYKYQKNKRKQLRAQLVLKDELSQTKTQNKLQEQRLRISRDLHDNIGSQLTFIISSIDNLKFLTKTSDSKLKDKLSNINNFATSTISQLRDTIWAMNKNEITYQDFYGRVLGLIEKTKLAKNDVKFNLKNNVKSNIIFSSVIGINIFRVIQESINNTLKYAEASQIDIDFSEEKNTFNILIKDNGKGFDITTVEFGNGLNNMQKRIEEINGKIDLTSTINQGTSIHIRLDKNTTNAV
ncbi:MAG: hypothetical protein COA67_06720 [Lutibacter sp.]|nr:MAG: hypothetical protein COA67_06720 [Lutibacter sp.]